MNDRTRKRSFFRPFADADDLRPILFLVGGQIVVALLSSILITNGLLG